MTNFSSGSISQMTPFEERGTSAYIQTPKKSKLSLGNEVYSIVLDFKIPNKIIAGLKS